MRTPILSPKATWMTAKKSHNATPTLWQGLARFGNYPKNILLILVLSLAWSLPVYAQEMPNPPVCMRHAKVQEVIIQNVHGKSRCEDITAADLAAITVLVHFGGFDFVPPKRSDFAGLTTLLNLDISGNNNFDGLTTLPADLFQGLPALRNLNLTNNQLSTLPIGIFQGLSLIGLTLSGNPWVSFPTNMFNEMASVSQTTRMSVTGLAPINAALPVASGTIPAQSLALTANSLTVEVATFFSDPGDTLTYTAMSADPAIASVAISDSTLTITPVALGTTNITVTATDTAGQPVTQTFALTVTNVAVVNQPPTANGTIADITNLVYDGAVATVDVADKFTDPNDILTFSAASNATAIASVSVTNNSIVTITSVAAGSATITVTATDRAGQTAEQTFTVTVINPAPIIVGTIADITDLVQNGAVATVNVAGKFSDPGDVLAFSVASSAIAIASVALTNKSIVTITPVAAGSATITVTATDTEDQTITQSFMVSVAENPTDLCSRSPGVRANIIEKLSKSCEDVTPADLASIETLDFRPAENNEQLVGTLKSGDFVGLTGLERLRLNGNQLTTLPADIFAGLQTSRVQTSFEVLWLQNNDLTSLPAGIFAGLIGLITLNLSSNPLPASLPASLFADMPQNARIILPEGTTILAAPNISPSMATLTATIGTAIADIIIDSSAGGAVASYSIDPAIGNGLSFDETTGTISGTPTAVADALTYTITATNASGSNDASVEITVQATLVAPDISTSRNILIATQGVAITPTTITNNGGAVPATDGYSIDPAITNGLSFNPNTGSISGTPAMVADAVTYTITATNAVGMNTTTVTITVQATLAAPDISANMATLIAAAGIAIADITMTNSGGAVPVTGGYGITPPIANGLSFNPNTGTIFGTPTAVADAVTYTITATNATGMNTATVTITVQATLAAPDISANMATLIATAGIAIADITMTNNGGAVPATDGYGIMPVIANGLSFSTSTGSISGTPTAVADAVTYTITATNATGMNTATVTITVQATLAAPDISANMATLIATAGIAIADITMTNSGGAVPVTGGYGITPPIANGLSFNPNTGTIFGTPTAVADAVTYTITATNATGSAMATVVITVNALAAPSITLSTDMLIATAGTAIADITITNNGGAIPATDGYSITPPIANGLSFSTSTGTISGTPTAVADAVTYTITATNATGSAMATVVITVNALASPSITLSTDMLIATAGIAIADITMTNSGGAIPATDGYSITPPIANGLSFSTSTGSISGTPTAVADAVTYTITATNATGSATATVVITVNATSSPTAIRTADVEEIDVSVSPNPIKDGARVTITVASEGVYHLLGISGEFLTKGTLTKGDNAVIFPSLAKGIYLLQIQTKHGRVTRKVVKN